MPTDEPVTDAVAVVLAFNEAINSRDVAALAALMTPAHRFIDCAGATTDDKGACVQAWRGFFDTFPDYRNAFENIADDGDGVVIVRGRSECSFAALDGPAAWRAVRRRSPSRCLAGLGTSVGRMLIRAERDHHSQWRSRTPAVRATSPRFPDGRSGLRVQCAFSPPIASDPSRRRHRR